MPLTIDDVVRLDEIDADIETEEDMTAYGIADLIWMRGLLEQALAERETAVEALHRVTQWSEAYPLDIFPEPDWVKARVLLEAGGITIDAISASCMRRVVEGVGKIAREALEEEMNADLLAVLSDMVSCTVPTACRWEREKDGVWCRGCGSGFVPKMGSMALRVVHARAAGYEAGYDDAIRMLLEVAADSTHRSEPAEFWAGLLADAKAKAPL